MKSIVTVLLILIATQTQAQIQQHTDSLPSTPGWHLIYSDPTYAFGSVSFPTSAHGWAIGSNAKTFQGMMLHTTDSGNTWQPVPSYPGGGAVHFVTDSIGYILATTIYKTTDAGTSWKSTGVSIPGSTNSWSFPSLDTFFLQGFGTSVRTTDAGATWSSNGDLGGCTAVSFSDHLHGYVGGQVNVSPADSGRPQAANFARTTDGGATWIPTYSHLVGQTILQLYSPKPHTIIAATDLYLARSTNDGWSWDTSNRPSGYVMGLSFRDSLHGIAACFGGKVNYTSDGGRTWSVQNTPTTKDFYDGQLLANGEAFVVSDAGLILGNRNISEMGVSNTALPPLPVEIFPNPSNSIVQFQYSLTQPEHVTFQVYDNTGMIVATLAASQLQSGPQSLSLATAQLASGNYLFQLLSESYQSSGSFTVVK